LKNEGEEGWKRGEQKHMVATRANLVHRFLMGEARTWPRSKIDHKPKLKTTNYEHATSQLAFGCVIRHSISTFICCKGKYLHC